MQRKRFTEEQIIRIVQEAETLGHVRDVWRQHNIAEQPLYRWRRQFGGREVADAKRLRALERENAALKRLGGALTLDNRMLKDVLGKKWEAWRPSGRRLPLWHRPITAVSDAPAGYCPCSAVPSVSSQAKNSRSSWLHVFLRFRSARRGVASARFLPC
jgi:putative transposase